MPTTHAALHARLMALPGAELDHPFGPEVDVYKLRGKVFAILVDTPDGARVTLKCDPVLAEVLREAHPAAIRPGYHTDKRHWNTVHLEQPLPQDVLWNMVEASWDLVRRGLPKKVQAGI